MSSAQPQRVAIYTRKSSEEGLEQEFNSLHAQREACEAFILSQRELGWKLLPTAYDDGGLSGGSLERPALQKLLEDVRAKRIDVIVVYKIDRLTRSLMDFTKIVSTLDEHEVSFVSVTQQFNTSTSMGRLTLNRLLSFAQFEREVTAERIRDKFAASKARGMWMGGVVPLGYDVRDRKLHINEEEAESIRWLFNTYLELKSVIRLREAAFEHGIRSKQRNYKSGKNPGGTPLTRGHLHAILTNPVYTGMISHKGKVYEGQHEAILDQEVFDRVQAQLKTNAVSRQHGTNKSHMHLLTGLLFDESGDRLSPTHATNRGIRYRYYISHRLLQARRKETDGWRLPAKTLEGIIIKRLIEFLTDQSGLINNLGNEQAQLSAAAIEAITKAAKDAADTLKLGAPNAKRQLLQALIARIAVAADLIRIEISRTGLHDLTGCSTENQHSRDQKVAATNREQEAPIVLKLPMRLRRRGVEARLIIGDQTTSTATPDPALVRLVADASAYLAQLTKGDCRSLAELSAITGQSPTEISRMLPLAFLAPDITRAILTGKHPVELTAQTLKRTKPIPANWSAQRQKLGFAKAV